MKRKGQRRRDRQERARQKRNWPALHPHPQFTNSSAPSASDTPGFIGQALNVTVGLKPFDGVRIKRAVYLEVEQQQVIAVVFL